MIIWEVGRIGFFLLIEKASLGRSLIADPSPRFNHLSSMFLNNSLRGDRGQALVL
jgi:hypothetical protein